MAEPAPLPLPSRREIVASLARAAGVTPLVLGLFEGTARALPRTESTDISILEAAVALEEQAIAIYDDGTRHGLVPTGLRHYAVEFRGDHVGHRDTQVAILEERGGRAPHPAKGSPLGSVAAGDHWVRQALTIEIAAQDAYGALISQIGTKDYLLSAAFILVDEIRHMTVWRRVLGLKIY